MELLAQGAMVERFERKKVDVKHRLNDLVDDLFSFMVSEITAMVPLPAIMSTAGGATITMVQPPPPPLQPQMGLGAPSVPSSALKVVFPSSNPAVQTEISMIKEEDAADGSLDDDFADESNQHLPAEEEISPPSSSQQLSHLASALQAPPAQHHLNGYCDSDSESCECYDCMDESLVKVEMNEDGGGGGGGGDDLAGDQDQMIGYFHLEAHQNRRNKRPKGKRQRSNDADGAAFGQMEANQGGDGDEGEEEGEGVHNNHQIETVGLKCWFVGCQAMLEDRAKLNQHLFFEHEKTLPYHCRVVGCGRQFDVRKDFWHHIRTGHLDYTCSICSTKFNGYFPFITHEFQLHEEGIFKCSREDCDFVAPLRDLIYKHTKSEHVKFICSFDGCGQSFECYSYLKRHRRIHSQVKPYRCKYPSCGYSSTQCGAVIQHIRIRHFKLPSSVKKQKELNIIDHRNPNDYLEVLTELLN